MFYYCYYLLLKHLTLLRACFNLWYKGRACTVLLFYARVSLHLSQFRMNTKESKRWLFITFFYICLWYMWVTEIYLEMGALFSSCLVVAKPLKDVA